MITAFLSLAQASAETVKLKPVPMPSGLGTYTRMPTYRSDSGTMDFGGKKMFVIKSRKKDFQIDLNLNGKIDPDEKKKYKSGSEVTVTVPLGNETIEYELRINQAAFFYSQTCLSGLLGKLQIYLIDWNVNGIFGEIGKDKIYIGPKKEHHGYSDPIQLEKIMSVDGKIMHLESKDGELSFMPYKGPVSQVVLKTPDSWHDDKRRISVSYRLKNIDNSFRFIAKSLKPGEKQSAIEVIPGTYTVETSSLVFQNGTDRSRLWGKGCNKNIIIEKGDFVINASAELAVDFQAVRNKSGAVSTQAVWFYTSTLGERYRAESCCRNTKNLVASLNADGKTVGQKVTLDFG